MTTQTRLIELLEYRNGELYWKQRLGRKDPTRPAGTIGTKGYRSISVDGKKVYVHRAIWIWHHGNIPEGFQIDHINGAPSDNRINNLRLVTAKENMRNMKRRCDNTSGFTGVYFCNWYRAWKAYLRRNGRNIYLGSFGTKEEAAAARKVADVKFGFHKNHGRNGTLKQETTRGG